MALLENKARNNALKCLVLRLKDTDTHKSHSKCTFYFCKNYLCLTCLTVELGKVPPHEGQEVGGQDKNAAFLWILCILLFAGYLTTV